MRTLLFFSALLLSTTLLAQRKVEGRVLDNRSRPISAASVSIKDSYDGGITDAAGNFSFETSLKDSFLLQVSAIGYHSEEMQVVTNNAPLLFKLKEKIDELRAVTVTAGSFEASDRKRATAVLTNLDVLTVGGANADITSAIKTLPGAQQVGEQEGLFVRGGTGAETKQFIDGMVVANPFYSSAPDIAARGRFSPGLFKGTVFSTGGYSALYGQALSSVVLLESIDMPEKSSATASISSVFVGAGIQELSKSKKASYGINYGYTNLLPYFKLVPQAPDYFRIPEFHTADLNLRFKTKGGIVKYFSSFSYSQFGLKRPDIDSSDLLTAFGLKNTNWYNNITWRENLGGGWKIITGAAFSINNDDISQHLESAITKAYVNPSQPWLSSKPFDLTSRQSFAQLRAVFEKKLTGINMLRFGSEYWVSDYRWKYNLLSTQMQDRLSVLFAETDLHISNALSLKAGLRAEHSSLSEKMNVAPRLAMAYKTSNNSQVSLAYGKFFQQPASQWQRLNNALDYEQSQHYIINYQRSSIGRTFRIESFYKTYGELIKTTPSVNNAGDGFARGVELFFRDKKTIKNLDYWVSYSYLDTRRNYLDFPGRMQPNFATGHTSSLVIKRFFSTISTGFNLTYSFATGRPYYHIDNNGGKPVLTDEGKTKSYHNLGFSANYVTRIRKAFAVVVVSVTNVTGATQVFGYNYSHDGKIKQAIHPPAERFVFAGLFLSWGIDRTDDAINNNL